MRFLPKYFTLTVEAGLSVRPLWKGERGELSDEAAAGFNQGEGQRACVFGAGGDMKSRRVL